jgi:hypothetical protein
VERPAVSAATSEPERAMTLPIVPVLIRHGLDDVHARSRLGLRLEVFMQVNRRRPLPLQSQGLQIEPQRIQPGQRVMIASLDGGVPSSS